MCAQSSMWERQVRCRLPGSRHQSCTLVIPLLPADPGSHSVWTLTLCELQVADAGSLLTAAGFNIPSVDLGDWQVHYKDFQQLTGHLRWGAWFCNRHLKVSGLLMLHG